MKGEYEVSQYRWVNLALYTLVTFMAGMGFLALAPMLGIMAERWAVGFGAASLTMSVMGLFQVILSIPTGWATGKIGFKLPVAIGATLLALGFVLRGSADSYGLFMFYTVVSGIGWGIIWAPIGNLAATWFPGREIGLANSIWPVGFLAGQALGSLSAIPLMINLGWNTMWLVHGIVGIVVALVTWLFLRARPRVPPEPRPPIKPAGVLEGIRQTMNRPNVALQYTVFASVGSLAVAPAIVPPMLIAKGVAPPLAGLVAGLPLVGATLGALLIPPLAFSRRQTHVAMLIGAILAPLCFIGLFLVPVGGGAIGLAILLSLVFGFVMASVMSISMGVGQMQPGVNPGNAGILSGVFLTSIGLGAAVFPSLVGGMVDTTGVMGGAWLLTGLAAVSVIVLALFVPEPKLPEGPPPGH